MTYRKSDGPFGLLPKKTAMDLEWGGELYTVLPQRETEARNHRGPELDLPASRAARTQPEKGDQGRSSP